MKPILYVEDDDNDVFLMNRAFKECGITNPLLIANDGQEAIDQLSLQVTPRENQDLNLPAFILLDLNLPGKNGHDVLKWIRASPTLGNLVVVVFTSSSHDLDVYKAYDLGVNGYVVKPPIFDALLDTVKTIRDFWLKQNFAPPLMRIEGEASKSEAFSN